MAYRILVVDDDPVIVRLIQHRLQEEGYLVVTADSIHAARAVEGPFDLLLVDVGLPDGDGFEVLRAFPDTPALTMSGAGDPDLRKPFSIPSVPVAIAKKLEEIR